MIYLHKILPQFLMPIMVFIVVFVLSQFKGYKKISYVAVGLLYALSTPVISDLIFKSVEGAYGYQDSASLEKADAIVVLSGMLWINELDASYEVEWGEACDRFFRGVELYEAGRASCLVFTSGKSPYNLTELSEGEILKKEAIKRGVPAQDILVSKVVLNTSAEAAAVSALLDQNKKIILITSAFHMKRAQHLFEKQGLEVMPYKVDFKTPPKATYFLIDFLPTAKALHQTEVAFRELLGRLYYGTR